MVFVTWFAKDFTLAFRDRVASDDDAASVEFALLLELCRRVGRFTCRELDDQARRPARGANAALG
jgi:hypothetical protein